MKRFFKFLTPALCLLFVLSAAACGKKAHLIKGEKEWRNAFSPEYFQNVRLDIRDEEDGEIVNPRFMIIAGDRTYYETETRKYYTEVVAGEKKCYAKSNDKWTIDTLDRTASMVDQIMSHTEDFSNFVYRSDMGGYVPSHDDGTIYVISFYQGKIVEIRSNVVGTMRVIQLTYGGQSVERPEDLK